MYCTSMYNIVHNNTLNTYKLYVYTMIQTLMTRKTFENHILLLSIGIPIVNKNVYLYIIISHFKSCNR